VLCGHRRGVAFEERKVMGIIAVQECSKGNAESGVNWLEAKAFSADTPISKVLDWSDELNVTRGRLILTVDKTS